MGNESKSGQPPATKHPLFGCIKGLVTISPDVDLTAPICPDWEAYEEAHYGPDSELGKIWAKAIEKHLEK